MIKPMQNFGPDFSAREKLQAQERLAQTVMISTASRRELETLCIQLGVPYQGQPSATLRQALKQRVLAVS
ncbi:MAG: hypothetical protein WA888_07205 [Burkholderiaceae bacterium]